MKLYTRNTTVDVMRVDNVFYQNIRTENSPMNRNTIKLHRGVDNEIRFRILNQDRKPVDINHLEVVAVMTNPENGERMLTKLLGNSPRKGFAQLRINEGDLMDIPPGYYNLVILGQEDLVPGQPEEVIRTPFYTDIGDNIVASVEVLASADPGPVPSYKIQTGDWRLLQQPSGTGADAIDEYLTSAIPAGRVRNHRNGLHTVAVFTDGFSGTLQVMATLDLQPPEDPRRWFPVDITSGTNLLEFNNYTGSTSFTFTANFTWLTFIKRPGWFPEDSVFRFPQAPPAAAVVPVDNTALDSVFEDITNPGGYTVAANLLRLNRGFLQRETRAWVEQEYPDLMTPQQEDLCDRDVGLMVDGMARDLEFGGYQGAREAAEAYFNNGNLILPPGQESPTARTYRYLESLAADVIRNVRIRDTVLDRVAERFEDVANPGGFTVAAQLLRANREFFKADIKAWVKRRFPNLMSITQGYLCDRDVGLIVDGLARDLEIGGFQETRRAADSYFNRAQPVLPTGQNSPTAQTYLQLLRLAERVIRNASVFNTPPRGENLLPVFSRLPAQDPVARFFRGITNPGGFTAAADLLEGQREVLQDSVALWVDTNFPGLLNPTQQSLCRRDVGTIVDSLADDLRGGGVDESKRSAEYYFQAGFLVLPPGQKSATAASFDYLLSLIDGLFSADPAVDQLVVTPIATDLVEAINSTIRDPFRGTVDRFFQGVISPGGYTQAADVIQANRTTLQTDTRTWVESQFPTLMTPQQQDLCERDVGLVIDSVTQDLRDGGVLGSKLSAGFYFNWGDPVLPANQESPSAQTFEYLAGLIQVLVDADPTVPDPAAVNSVVTQLVAGINESIRNPQPSPVPPRFDFVVNPGGYNESAQILRDNRAALQSTVRQWVTSEFPSLMTSTQAALCDRDVGLIVDGLALDLENGGADEAIRAGESYWAGGDLVLPVTQKSPTAQTFRYLEESVCRLLNRELTVEDPTQVDLVVRDLITGINSVITDPFQNPLAPAFPTTGRLEAAAMVSRNRLFLQTEVREWVAREFPGLMNTTQQELCDRDVGLVIQGLIRDLESGSATEALRAAQSYFGAGMPILPANQKNPSADTFDELNRLIQLVIRNVPIPATQNVHQQVFQPALTDPNAPQTDLILNDLVGGVTSVLRKPTQVALTLAGINNPGGYVESALLLATNRAALQTSIRTWVTAQYPALMNSNQRDLCDRDVGLIVDALVADLSAGGVLGSLRAALAYYNDGVPVLPTGQKSPTARSYEQLAAEIQALFTANLVTDDDQVTGGLVSQLIDGINRIIRNPFSDPGRVTLAFAGINNVGGYVDSAAALTANRVTLQSQVRDWVAATYPGLLNSSQAAACDRDVGLIIDGLITDLTAGGVAGVRLAAVFYYNDGVPVLPTGQQSPTAASFRELTRLIRNLLDATVTPPENTEAGNVVTVLIDALNDVIQDPFRDPTALLFDTRRAAELLTLNREFMKTETREWVEFNYPTLMTPAQANLCDRDVGLVIDGFVADLLNGGSTRSLRAAEAYFNWGHPVLPSPQGAPSAMSFMHLAQIADAVIRNTPWVGFQSTVTQTFRPSLVVSTADVIQERLDRWVDGINSAILNPPALPEPFTRQVIRPELTVSNPEAVDAVMNSLIGVLNGVIQDPPFLQVTTGVGEPQADDATHVIHAHIEAVNRVIVTPPQAPIISNTVVNPFFADINNPGGFDGAADLLMANIDFIRAELRTWVNRVFPSLMTPSQASLCDRDVGLIVESLARPRNVAKPQGDLRQGGFGEMLRSAQAYFNQGTPLLPTGQESPTAQTYERLALLATDIIRNRPIVNPEQADVPQVFDGRVRVLNASGVDSTIGALIDALNRVIKFPPVPTEVDVDSSAVAPLFAGIDNPGGFDEAANIISTNRASLQSSTRAWISQQYPGLMNSSQEALCDRDVGLIIDALARPAGGALRPGDLRVGGFRESLRAAEAYFNNGNPVLPTGQQSPTAASFSYLVQRINSLLETGVSNDLVSDRFLGVNNTGGFTAAASVIANNRSALRFATRQWVQLNYPNLMSPEQVNLCDRDVGLIIDALVRDLRDGGFAETLRAAQAYFNNGVAILPTGQLSPTAATFDYLVSRIQGLLLTGSASNLLLSRFDTVTNPGGFGSAANIIEASRETLQLTVKAWVAMTYPGLMTPAQETLCDRDVGLIIDGITSDLRRGGFQASLRAAEAYFNNGSPVLPVSQESPTAATFVRLAEEISSITALQSDPQLITINNVIAGLVSGVNSAITNPPPVAPFNSVNNVPGVVQQAQELVDVLNGVIKSPPAVSNPPQIPRLAEVKTVIGTLVAGINNTIKSPPIPRAGTGEITKIILR